MTQTTRCIAVILTVLGASVAALGQEAPARPGDGSPFRAAIDALDLTDEQVAQIREIRRERPDRDKDQEERTAARDGQRARIQEVLTEEQRAKVGELESAGEQMRAYMGAVLLGLAEAPGRRGGFGAFQDRGRRDGRQMRSDRRGRGRPGPRRWNGRRGPGDDRSRRGPRPRGRGGRR